MDRLISIIRNNSDLTARLVRQTVAPDFEACEEITQVGAETNAWYEILEKPLEKLEAGLFPNQERLLNAWQMLAQVREETPEVLSTLQMVLTETVLETPVNCPVPLRIQTGERTVKPTAAHPRAFQGTTYKPPREKTPSAADLRPLLCSASGFGFAPDGGKGNFSAESRLPESFRTSLYWIIRQQSGEEIGDALALYWALGLNQEPSRLAAVAYLFSLEYSPNTCGWCRFVAGLPEEAQTLLLSVLIASGAYMVKVQDLPPSFAEQVTEVFQGPEALYRVYWLLYGLKRGIAPEYLLSGYRLANIYEKSCAFHKVSRSGYVPIHTLLRYEAHCRSDDDFYPGILLHLWEQCGLRPGLGEFLERTDWTQHMPEVACRCLRLYASSWDNWGDISEEQANARWLTVRPHLPAMESLLQSIPSAFQKKCVWHLIEYLWQWDTPTELKANLPESFVLIRRLCRLPFSPKSDVTAVATAFLAELSSSLRKRFLDAPDMSFQRLEQACRRDNDSWLIRRGTWALTRQAGEFAVRCFEECPVLLFKVAKLLGCLSGPMREAVVRDFDSTDAEANARQKLEILEQGTLLVLAQGLSPTAQTSTDKHALQIQSVITDNRRALRKFLEAHWRGQTNYRQEHFRTRRWLDKHPGLDLTVWQEGISYEADTEEWGRALLKVETDPLEALKLGTYVGSCLGLGGSFAYSAAAAVLDINKQVVYARTVRGTVIGRQLIALSETGQMVCFEVYPLTAQDQLGRLFAEFDIRLAQALGLPIHLPSRDDDYEITSILSQDWWDDQAWDLTTVDGD